MTDLYAAAERAMRMDDATWRRHANPWSGWTRIVIGPLLALAIWSRVWLGWGALVPIAALLAWTWINPRAFPPPADHGTWIARAVLGERVWLERDRFGIEAHHRRAANLATALAVVGVVPLAAGLWTLDVGWTVAGAVLTFGGKFWFLDRMVWLHADVTGTVPGTPLPHPTPFDGETP